MIYICLISSQFPPISIGGIERYLMNLSQALGEQGYGVTVLTRHYLGLLKAEKSKYYEVLRVGLNPFPFSSRRLLGQTARLFGDFFSYSVLGFYEGISKLRHLNLVNSQLGSPYDLQLGRRISDRLSIPHVITIHGRFGSSSGDRILSPDIRKALERADYIVTNRRSNEEMLLGIGIPNVVALGNPIPVYYYSKPKSEQSLMASDEITVLFIGRLTPRRGPDLALKAFAYAARRLSHLRLLIVGSGNLEVDLKRLAEKEGITKRVSFLGRQPDVRRFLWRSHVFLATSPIANSPSLALREAMAAGLSVIATDVEDTKEVVISGKTGIVVPPNPKKVGEALVRLAQDDRFRSNLSNAAAAYAEREFGIEKYVERLTQIYDKLMS